MNSVAYWSIDCILEIATNQRNLGIKVPRFNGQKVSGQCGRQHNWLRTSVHQNRTVSLQVADERILHRLGLFRGLDQSDRGNQRCGRKSICADDRSSPCGRQKSLNEINIATLDYADEGQPACGRKLLYADSFSTWCGRPEFCPDFSERPVP